MHLSSIQGFPGKQNFEKNDALPRLRNTGNTFSNSNTQVTYFQVQGHRLGDRLEKRKVAKLPKTRRKFLAKTPPVCKVHCSTSLKPDSREIDSTGTTQRKQALTQTLKRQTHLLLAIFGFAMFSWKTNISSRAFRNLYQTYHPLGIWIIPWTSPVHTAPVITKEHITRRPTVAIDKPQMYVRGQQVINHHLPLIRP